MIHPIRARLVAVTAAAMVALGGSGAARAAASAGYQPFVTDFPKGTASTEFTPFVSDFGLAQRTPGDPILPRSAKPVSAAQTSGHDWAAIGAAAGLGLAALAAAAVFGVRRRRRSFADAIGAAPAGTAK
jgi:MYXO-CTERM domain-containing protein